jgi:dihydroorotase
VPSAPSFDLVVKGGRVVDPAGVRLTKLMALGMSLDDVIAAATSTPAALIGEAGTLTPGVPADIAVLALEPGPFEVRDVLGKRLQAPQRLRAVRTFVGGRELAPGELPPPPPWISSGPGRAAPSR